MKTTGYELTSNVGEESKFSEHSEWRDLPFLLLFVLHFAGIGV